MFGRAPRTFEKVSIGAAMMLALASAGSAQEAGPAAYAVSTHEGPDRALHSGIHLDFFLTGVALRREASYALIGVSGGADAAYRVGEQLRPGVVLAAIFPDRVAIARHGTLEWLLLRGKITTASAPVAAIGEDAGRGESPPPAIGNSGAARPYPLRVGREMTRQASIATRPDGGFQVKRVQPGSAFEEMGLRAGDLLFSVNGQPIDPAGGLAGLYRQIESGTDGLSVQVLRGGRLEELSRASH